MRQVGATPVEADMFPGETGAIRSAAAPFEEQHLQKEMSVDWAVFARHVLSS